MAENEELRLSATLVDDASAGIVASRGQIQQLGSGATAQQLELQARQTAPAPRW